MLVLALREPPLPARLVNALEHMWGHVRGVARGEDKHSIHRGPVEWLATIQRLAAQHREKYLLSSTALSELAAYVHNA